MAYGFNGTNQYLTAPAAATTHPITISCWFIKNNSNNMALVTLANTSAVGDRFGLICNSNNQLIALENNDPNSVSASAVVTSPAYSVSTWAHGAGVFTSTTSRTAFFGGSSVTNTDTRNPNGINQLAVGVRNNSSLVSYINGLIAEVGIWNVALTQSEIASLARGVTCDKIRPQNLAFYAPLIRDLQDTKGGLIITPNNGPIVSPHPRIYK